MELTEKAETSLHHKWQILNATTLKIIAVILMFLDHVHQMYAWDGAPLWLTMLGRPVFPMFMFIASESFHYTSNRKKYLKRLLLSSCGMTIFTFVLQMIVPNIITIEGGNCDGCLRGIILYFQRKKIYSGVNFNCIISVIICVCRRRHTVDDGLCSNTVATL